MIRTLPSAKEMQRAVLARDGSYDGLFFVCVKTTRIFCKPSCPARKPKPANMEYRSCVRDCLLRGFRPCKRCRPLADNGESPPWLDELLARVERDPAGRLTDQDLREMSVNPHRARRYFQRSFGMTFQAYHRSRRMGLALEELRAGRDPLTVGLDHGYDSDSGFREAFAKTFGTTPGRSHGVAAIKTTTIESPLGPLVAGATEEGVCLLEFADRRAFAKQIETLKRRTGGAIVPGTCPHLERLESELREYFDGARVGFTVPMIAPGTDFQQRVWSQLRRIPYGETTSYERLARAIGRPGARRAVGRANGDNRIAILIPCHRVVRSDGTLCGYGGGLWRKRFLLDLERA
jgi:AraC family transcriptional regulator of adaptative response/methylated-DNA-[protein]-cysteine methyltransferase